ncbi:MAG: hypothetical protein GX448_04480 [Planctomycetes bacterium]|nr:hypothetical protein [Planctomycetota bacterium]
MTARTLLKRIHVAATIWFIVCVGCLVTIALHQAGLKWWLIFPLSGHSILMMTLLVSLYLFAFFRGVDGARYNAIEHPLTSSDCYLGFYVSTPLIGGLLALAAISDDYSLHRALLVVPMGTLGTTFFVWIVIDPLAGMIETLLPASRRHRAERLAARE